MEKKGQINIYICENCEHQIITINLDDGVTSAFIDCVLSTYPKCLGIMASRFYRVPQDLDHTHEWHIPDEDDFDEELNAGVRHHVEQGGLVLRKRIDSKKMEQEND